MCLAGGRSPKRLHQLVPNPQEMPGVSIPTARSRGWERGGELLGLQLSRLPADGTAHLNKFGAGRSSGGHCGFFLRSSDFSVSDMNKKPHWRLRLKTPEVSAE